MDKREHNIDDEVLYDNFGKEFESYQTVYKIIEIDKRVGYLIGNDDTKPFHAQEYQVKAHGKYTSRLNLKEDILIYAFRYCLGRKTYAVSDCVSNILANWNELTPRAKDLFYSEIKKCDNLGMDMDEIEWMKIIERYDN